MGRQAEDLTGRRYGRLIVIRRGPNQGKRVMWLCKCDCGTEKVIGGQDLRNGKTKSCGCFLSEATSQRNRDNATHRETGSRLYRIWRGMKARCYYKKQFEYERYGGRGITVCEEWRTSYETFRDWALSNDYKSHLTLDRINTNGNYEPDNCRWATYKEQCNNRTNNRLIEFNGDIKTISQWSDTFGLSRYQTIKKLGID